MTNYKSLEAWKQSMQLVKEVYELVKIFPKDETFSLASQAKRAAISVPANIAEGAGRNFKKESIHFFHISRGSLYELETLLNISSMVNIVNEDQLKPVSEHIDECMRILNGLIRYFKNLKS